ncbi:helicase associated domain-containing protein [Streptomyces sp. NPDC058667]|uniref:helicase associated domain-containing protein n=1 Tax=Streptomyces sp. NPDC058667 TaxID=3346588 RepID=UPI003650870D
MPAIAPGVVFEGDDIGRWLERQKNPGTWAQLLPEQQQRLAKLGVQLDQTPSPTPAAARAAKGPEQGAADVPAGPRGPHAVGGAGRRPAGAKGSR